MMNEKQRGNRLEEGKEEMGEDRKPNMGKGKGGAEERGEKEEEEGKEVMEMRTGGKEEGEEVVVVIEVEERTDSYYQRGR